MRIRWEEEALSDLIELRNFITQENPAAAQVVAKKIIEKTNLLSHQPFMGGAGRIFGTRELVITSTPYTVTYHPTAELITILHVFHQTKKWPRRQQE